MKTASGTCSGDKDSGVGVVATMTMSVRRIGKERQRRSRR
jgi:hypothetical protein